MKPLDPRLLAYAAGARRFLLAGAALSVAQAAGTVAFAFLAAKIITDSIGGAALSGLVPLVGALAAVIILRVTVGWLGDWAAARAAASVKSELRMRLAAAIDRLGPDWLAGQSTPKLAVLMGPGLDALDAYFGKYLPQLVLTAIAMPVLLGVIAINDPLSGFLVAITIPVIPVFMILIGMATRTVQQKQWTELGALGTAFLDIVDGLSTLTIFGRQHRQATRIERITESYRVRTMRVLRVSFISGFALELAASLSVALVAVAIGLRLVDGELALSVGLFVLLLTPEAYLPLRQVGVQFHAAAEGVAAAGDLMAVLDEEKSMRPAVTVASTARGDLELSRVAVVRGGDPLPAVNVLARAGEVTVLAGPSGSGKSSIVAALLGFAEYTGAITVGGTAVGRGELLESIAWSAQRTELLAGTVATNVSLGSMRPDPSLIRRALSLAACHGIEPELELSIDGDGLSGGQRQRVGLARAFYRAIERDSAVLVLDEPTSALDEESQVAVLAGIRFFADAGRVVVVTSHRAAVMDAADRVVIIAAEAVAR